jgi:hypothetical protein
MQVIGNINRLLDDCLWQSIGGGAKLKIAAAGFSNYAYEALKQELEKMESLEFFFMSRTFVTGSLPPRDW